jgi:hypothetical protein
VRVKPAQIHTTSKLRVRVKTTTGPRWQVGFSSSGFRHFDVTRLSLIPGRASESLGREFLTVRSRENPMRLGSSLEIFAAQR